MGENNHGFCITAEICETYYDTRILKILYELLLLFFHRPQTIPHKFLLTNKTTKVQNTLFPDSIK